MADHAVLGPDGLAIDVPGAQQDLDRLGHPEAGVGERFAQCHHLAAPLVDRKQLCPLVATHLRHA